MCNPSLSLLSTSDTGVSSADGVTNDNTPTLSGQYSRFPTGPVANATLEIYDGSTLLGTVVTGVNGEYQFTAPALTDGQHTLYAIDALGNNGPPNNTIITVDTIASTAVVNIVDTTLTTSDTTSIVTFDFSEVPMVFDNEALTVVGGSLSTVTVDANDPTLYTATFTSTPGFSGQGSVSLTAGALTDVAGNSGVGVSDTVSIGLQSVPSTPSIPTSGPDVVYGGSGPDTISGGLGNDTILAGAGNDVINGNVGDDSVQGADGNDLVQGGRGNDFVFGGEGNDIVNGDRGNDFVNGNQGADIVNGNMGNDTVHGGQDNDEVHGGQGDDFVFGDLGNDQVWGDLGNDTLTGGAGADTFHFAANSGNDIIVDYSRTDGDTLDFGGQTFTVADVNGSAVFTLSGGGTVVLTGVSSATLDASDFV